jgi:UDP-3-O-[3-hydroxymyristoyl] glucosamine N-acyltransferase
VQTEFSLGELAVRFGLTLRGESSLTIRRVATLSRADAGSLSFFTNSKYRKQPESTAATAVLLAPTDLAMCPVAALIDSNPYLAYARIATLMYPQPPHAPGIHATAVVAGTARIAPSASIGPLSVIEADVQIGERAYVGPGCIVHRGTRIGADSQLTSHVTLYAGVSIGERCILHAGAVVGADGFGFAPNAGVWVKIPQVGSVRVGDDVEIGANTTIDRGAIDDTVIENGVKLDNQIQVGHNVIIGAHTIIAACTGISGSTVIGQRCMIGGMVGFAGHLKIADDVEVTGCTLVSASIKQPGIYSSGMPAVEARLWRRMVAHLRRLAKRNDDGGIR